MEFITDRLKIFYNNPIKLKLLEESSGLRIYELIDSNQFNINLFRIELLKSRYSNEFIEEELEEEGIITLHLRRVYLKSKLVVLIIKFIKRDTKNLIISIQILNKIDYDKRTGREYFY